MRLSRRWLWVIGIGVILLLLLPMPIAERYTSSTQDGQYLLNPVRSYRFLVSAALVSTSSELKTSGRALERAKQDLEPELRPTKVELLFLTGDEPYEYTTRDGETLRVEQPERFVWEVWGIVRGSGDTQPDVIALMDYDSGQVLVRR